MNRKTKVWVILAVSLLIAAAAIAIQAAEEKKPATVTVQGEILDMACYVGHGAKGAEHAGCAKACAKSGQPIGLLAKDGQVYLLYARHDDASAFEQAKGQAGQNVEIVGVAGKQGAMNGLEVHSVKAL